jgi:hypothetical protein
MPHVGFRFGMIHELEMPFGIDLQPLEAGAT